MPIYAQLEREIRTHIATGRLKTGDQLPTVRQLAVDLRINANTVARVYAELERSGTVETRRGIGTFVLSNTPSPLGKPERQKEFEKLAQRFADGSLMLGFSLDDIIKHFEKKRKSGETQS